MAIQSLSIRSTADNPFQLFPNGLAAVAAESLDRATLRAQYEMQLALQVVDRSFPAQRPAREHRRFLLQFRRAIQTTEQLGYHHRWLAATYWERADDIKVDVSCTAKTGLMSLVAKKSLIKAFDNITDFVYDDWMLDSTFDFAPGGSGPGSYRFVEILAAGGIPVVTTDYAPPYQPELDWSSCLVFVPPERIVDLPRTLRNVSEKENAHRRLACVAFRDWSEPSQAEVGREDPFCGSYGHLGVSNPTGR